MSIAELGQSGNSTGQAGGAMLPPQDVHAEQSVLGSMMLSKDAIADAAELLKGIDFYRPAHESIYEAVIELYGRGEPADAITVADQLTKSGDLSRVGGQSYLHELIQSVPTAANAGFYAGIVAERAVLRRLVEAGTRIVQLGYAEGGGDVVDVINQAQAEVFGVTAGKDKEDYVVLRDVLPATGDEIEAAHSNSGQMVGVPTGFTDLDNLTNGLHGGQMIVVAARPAVGKSTLGLDICRAASIKHGMASIVFSLEMSKTEITMRLLSAEADIQLQHMRKGTMREEDWQKMATTMGKIADAPLFIDDSPNMSLMEIRSKCRRLKEQHNLKLVVIDYLQLMSSGKRVESRQQEVAEFSRALKLLAKELHVPVIAISQLNRGPEQRTDKRPQMSDLRESGCLTAETRLLRADTGAEVTIGALAESGEKDVPVWALDDSLRYVIRPLTHAFTTGVRPVFRLTLASGKTVRATENHRFLTYDGWRALGDLRTGDRIAEPRHVPAPAAHEPWESDEQSFVAMLDAHEKAVPEHVFHVSKRQIALFLNHVWATGGAVSLNEARTGGHISYASPSRRLLDDLSLLLLRFGISTRITADMESHKIEISGADSQRRFLQEIGVAAGDASDATELLSIVREATSRTDLEAASDSVWHSVRSVLTDGDAAPRSLATAPAQSASSRPERLGRVAQLLDSAELELLCVNDILWDSVVSVEPDGIETVYDATVVGSHNFIANGIAAHNSIEQDADMVILLHRDDAFNRDSERPGEADLIVAKHRNGPTDTITVAFQGHYSRFSNMAQNF